MSLDRGGASKIAGDVMMAFDPWTLVLFDDEPSLAMGVAELVEEFQFLLEEDNDVPQARVVALTVSTGDLARARELARQRKKKPGAHPNEFALAVVRSVVPSEAVEALTLVREGDVAIVVVDALDPARLGELDPLRDAAAHARIVFAATEARGKLFGAECPHVWSKLGGRCFSFDPKEGRMDVSARLASIKAAHPDYTDDDIRRLAKERKLPADPSFVEWAVLLNEEGLLG